MDDDVDDDSLLNAVESTQQKPAPSSSSQRQASPPRVHTGTQTFVPFRTLPVQTELSALVSTRPDMISTSTQAVDPEADDLRAELAALRRDWQLLRGELRSMKNKLEEMNDVRRDVAEMMTMCQKIMDSVAPPSRDNVCHTFSPNSPAPRPSPPASLTSYQPDDTADVLAPPSIHLPHPLPSLPPSTISTARPQDTTLASTDPIDRAVRDPYLDDLPPARACTTLVCRLTDIVFGPEVLARSNLSGRDDRTPLDANKVMMIKDIIKRKYGNKFATDNDFQAVWKRCKDSISTKCKNARKWNVR